MRILKGILFLFSTMHLCNASFSEKMNCTYFRQQAAVYGAIKDECANLPMLEEVWQNQYMSSEVKQHMLQKIFMCQMFYPEVLLKCACLNAASSVCDALDKMGQEVITPS
ncbi:hypothetical protein IPH25_01915 [bacterium]|nr:MAG: hypothetical protein IPG37_04045 [bacterium]QQR62182.1 MAG: hypothetical protein IPH25_01915 [bacterium]QQR63260.1 MAG: hypothetical protein IPH67_02185 [bacterium]